MKVVMVYSEAGGVSKTTTAVSLAQSAAEAGERVLLVDLDPRAAASHWLDVEPVGEGLHVGAILGDADPEGWAESLAVPAGEGWSPRLRVIPSARPVSNREADRADHGEVRLRTSLIGLDADVVVIDCPNRQGGPLTMSALTAADRVVYAAAPTGDGVNGVEGARATVGAFLRSRDRLGAPAALQEAGIVVSGVPTTIWSRPQTHSVQQLRETGLLLTPLVPQRAIVPEVRLAGAWFGAYTKGQPVAAAYTQLTKEILG